MKNTLNQNEKLNTVRKLSLDDLKAVHGGTSPYANCPNPGAAHSNKDHDKHNDQDLQNPSLIPGMPSRYTTDTTPIFVC